MRKVTFKKKKTFLFNNLFQDLQKYPLVLKKWLIEDFFNLSEEPFP